MEVRGTFCIAQKKTEALIPAAQPLRLEYLDGLMVKAKELCRTQANKKRTAILKLERTAKSALEGWMSDLTPNRRQLVEKKVDAYFQEVRTGGEYSAPNQQNQLPLSAADALEETLKQQDKIHKKYLQEIANIQSAMQKRIQNEVLEEQAKGNGDVQHGLYQAMKKIEAMQTEAFIQYVEDYSVMPK